MVAVPAGFQHAAFLFEAIFEDARWKIFDDFLTEDDVESGVGELQMFAVID